MTTRPRHRYIFVVLDATQRAADAVYDMGVVTATSAERAEGIVRRRYLADSAITGEDFDSQMVVEARHLTPERSV